MASSFHLGRVSSPAWLRLRLHSCLGAKCAHERSRPKEASRQPRNRRRDKVSRMTQPRRILSQRLGVQERELGFNASVSRAWTGRRPSGQLGLSAMRMMRTAVLVAIGTVSYTHLRAHETRHDLV